jgi:hypothetical protein
MCEPVKYQSCNICRSKPRRIIGDSQKYTHQQIISGVTANCDPKTPQQENTGKKQPGSGPKGKTEQVKSVGLRPDVVCEGKQETGRNGCHERRQTAGKFKQPEKQKSHRDQQQPKHHLLIHSRTNERNGANQRRRK